MPEILVVKRMLGTILGIDTDDGDVLRTHPEDALAWSIDCGLATATLLGRFENHGDSSYS
jgi:hypothetical protein